MSLPVRGAWIEIAMSSSTNSPLSSLPVRGAWIEIKNAAQTGKALMSLPVRGAWIEIIYVGGCSVLFPVAPRAGSVD